MKTSIQGKVVLVLNASTATGLAQCLFLRRSGYRTVGLLQGSLRVSEELPFEPVTSLPGEDSQNTVQQILSSFRRIHAVYPVPRHSCLQRPTKSKAAR